MINKIIMKLITENLLIIYALINKEINLKLKVSIIACWGSLIKCYKIKL